MKRIALGLAVLFCALQARADDKVEYRNEPDHKIIKKKHTDHHGYGRTMKVESKSRHRMGGGTVNTTETTEKISRPGLGNDSRRDVTETTERDEHGNVVRHEQKVDH